jgi:hypothetical protein
VERDDAKIPAKIVRENLQSIVIEAQGPGTLVLKDRWMTGWSATVNGAPATLEGPLWRSVNLESEGPNTIVMSYEPPRVGRGLILGTPIWILAIFLAAFRYLINKKAQKSAQSTS